MKEKIKYKIGLSMLGIPFVIGIGYALFLMLIRIGVIGTLAVIGITGFISLWIWIAVNLI